MDRIDKHLASAAIDEQFPVALRGSLALGKNLLNKYYSLSDCSDVYRIAVGVYFLSTFFLIIV